MTHPLLPARDDSARTGTNTPILESSTPRTRELAALAKARAKLDREFKARARGLFTKADLKRAQALLDGLRQQFHASNLALGPEREPLEVNSERFRKRVDREFTRALPGYREFRKLMRERRAAFGKLGPLRGVTTDRQLALGLPVLEATPSANSLTAPYPLFVQDHHTAAGRLQDDSFVIPDSGQLVQRYHYTHDDSGPWVSTIYGISWPDRLQARVGCGANIRTTGAGRLRVFAQLKNFYCNFYYSVEDLFGFSEAEFEISLCAWARVRQGERAYEVFEPLVSDGLTSFGSDLAYQMAPLDNTQPYTLDITTPASYEANTLLEVVAGVGLVIDSDVDDMCSHADGIGWWRLEQLTVDTVA